MVHSHPLDPSFDRADSIEPEKTTDSMPAREESARTPEPSSSWIVVLAKLLDDQVHGRPHAGTQLWTQCQETTGEVHRRVVGVFDRLTYPFVWLTVVLYHVTTFLQKNVG